LKKNKSSLIFLIRALWIHIGAERKRQIKYLFILISLTAVMEVFSIGTVIPFLSILIDPQQFSRSHLAIKVMTFLNIQNQTNLVLPIAIIFLVAIFLSGYFRLQLIWSSSRISYSIGSDLSYSVYRKTLYQDYLVHLGRNSSEIVTSVSNKISEVVGVIVMLLSMTGSIVMLLTILAALIYLNPVVALFSITGFSFLYFLILSLTKVRLLKNGLQIADASTEVIRSLQEGLGGIREVLIDGNQEAYSKVYGEADRRLRKAQASNAFISQSPRYLMESLGMFLIVVVAYLVSLREGGVIKIIPILGALALGAQRLLPILQQVYASISGIRGAQRSIEDVLDLLNQPLPPNIQEINIKKLPFEQEIYLKDINFRYSKSMPYVLKQIKLKIKKGETIGVIGPTGSGKSTILDILMGLLYPESGELLVDGVSISRVNMISWQKNIAHVPQEIFMTDGTIEENIAFGLASENINSSLALWAAEVADLNQFINSLPDGIKTRVGERGSWLSGGQRQRIGIARALYKKTQLLIFDEATSALDEATEARVIENINQLAHRPTILMVAHRHSSLKNCERLIEIKSGTT